MRKPIRSPVASLATSATLNRPGKLKSKFPAESLCVKKSGMSPNPSTAATRTFGTEAPFSSTTVPRIANRSGGLPVGSAGLIAA